MFLVVHPWKLTFASSRDKVSAIEAIMSAIEAIVVKPSGKVSDKLFLVENLPYIVSTPIKI